MWYVFDEHKNIADKDSAPYIVGSTYVFDGVEVYCLLGTANTDHPLFVDKNHDLSYYVNGSDYINSNDYNISPGTFGYEWGGYRTDTNIIATSVGTGLSNTNSLIEMNLQPKTSGWFVVWDKIKEFRQSHSNNWFLPSSDELNLICEARNNLNNLSTSTNPYYWSSSENSSSRAWHQGLNGTSQLHNYKYNHHFRSRLCYTI